MPSSSAVTKLALRRLGVERTAASKSTDEEGSSSFTIAGPMRIQLSDWSSIA